MQIQYDQVQAANLAPYLELMQKQQQQPMMDALNKQKLTQGDLQTATLQEVLRDKLKESTDMQLAQDIASKSMDKSGAFSRSMYLNQAKQAGLDPINTSKYLSQFLGDTGLNAQIAASIARATEAQKLKDAIALESIKNIGNIQTAKARKGNDAAKLIESMTKSIAPDITPFMNDANREQATGALGSAFAAAQTKPEQAAVADAYQRSLVGNIFGFGDLYGRKHLDVEGFNKLLAAYQNTISKNQVNNPYDVNATFGNPVPDVQYP